MHVPLLPTLTPRWLALVFTGCLLLTQRPLRAQVARPTSPTPATRPDLFTPSQRVVASVYPFRLASDQQTRNGPQTATVTQYTDVLLQTLRTSGWFMPVEAGNVGNLLNEPRPPLLPATETGSTASTDKPTLMLEAGLFALDALSLPAEVGALYFDNSSNASCRQDRATVYVRAFSTQSGKLLKTVYWTSTVLSQPMSGRTYRYVLLNRLYGNSNGSTETPPDQFALTEAIRQAVRGLVIEGVRDGLWSAPDLPVRQRSAVVAAYETEKNSLIEAQQVDAPPKQARRRPTLSDPRPFTLSLYGGSMRYHGDYVDWATRAAYGLSIEAYTKPWLGLQLNVASGTLASQNAFSTRLTSVEANVLIRPLSYSRLSPLLFGGGGLVSRAGASSPFAFEGNMYTQFQAGGGLQYSPHPVVGLRALLTYNMPRTDQLDGRRLGTHNDYYVRTTLGLVIHFGQPTAAR